MNRRNVSLLLALCVSARAALVWAHDFWLQPNEYWTDSNAPNFMTLQVGHGPARQRSPIPARRIRHFALIAPDGARVDLRPQLQLGQPGSDANFRFEKPGSSLLLLQTDDRAQTHLPALRFNDYLEAEGLTPALEQRTRLHSMAADGSERYSRCAKSILQIGPFEAGPHSNVSKPVGFPLEIVPEVNPYDVSRSTSLPIRVIYFGRPLAGALVKLTNLQQDAAPFEVHRTDGEGRAQFSVPNSGTWLLNVIWTKPLPRTDEVDFETVFSSLSFGFPSARP